MTIFLDLRMLWGGGEVSEAAQAYVGSSRDDYAPLPLERLQEQTHGKHLLIGTHGYNNNREQGIACLGYWESLLDLGPEGLFLGLLWPGDSESWHALSYPVEPKHAREAGERAARFVNARLKGAASLSLVSHSLGARVALQMALGMKRPVRRLILMAGAIDDDCLTEEYGAAATKAEAIATLASKKDTVLEWAFPLGNFAADLVDETHPWWSSALGRSGPSEAPERFQPPYQIPPSWGYNHGDYLRTTPPASARMNPPAEPQVGPKPLASADGWQQAWSAAFVSGRFLQGL